MSLRGVPLRAAVIIAVAVTITVFGAPRQPVLADDVEQRIAEFWKRVDALRPSDHLSSTDLGQWALNVIDRDPGAGLSVADFRASTAQMQDALDRASAGIPPAAPKSADVEGRIARFWQKVDALGPSGLLSAADLGQWALNVIDRDPSRRIRVDDFRAATAGMQGGLDRGRSVARPPASTPMPTPIPTPIPTPTPTCTPGPAIAVAGAVRWGRTPVAGLRVELWQRYDGGVLASTVTAADGRFTLRSDRPIEQDWQIAVPEQLDYHKTGVPVLLSQDPAAFCATAEVNVQLSKEITNISIAGTRSCGGWELPCVVASAPMAVSWSSVPGATYYCIEVVNRATGQWVLTGPVCEGSPSYLHVGPTTTYTVPSLPAGRYQFVVLALSGDRVPFGDVGSGDLFFAVN